MVFDLFGSCLLEFSLTLVLVVDAHARLQRMNIQNQMTVLSCRSTHRCFALSTKVMSPPKLAVSIHWWCRFRFHMQRSGLCAKNSGSRNCTNWRTGRTGKSTVPQCRAEPDEQLPGGFSSSAPPASLRRSNTNAVPAAVDWISLPQFRSDPGCGESTSQPITAFSPVLEHYLNIIAGHGWPTPGQ